MINSRWAAIGSPFQDWAASSWISANIEKDRGKLRRKLGAVNLAEKLRFVEEGKASAPRKQRNGAQTGGAVSRVKILGATVSCEAGHWYVSHPGGNQERAPHQLLLAVVGVDVGMKASCCGFGWTQA